MNFRLSAAALLAASALTTSAWAASPVTLIHAFDLAAPDRWQRQSIPLTEGNWRLGTLDGPVASASQLQSALSALESLTIAATCANTLQGEVVFGFCGLQLSRIDLGNAAADRFIDPAAANAGWLQTTGASSFDAEWSDGTGDEGGAISTTNSRFDTEPAVLSLLAPARYLGNVGGAYGANFSFSSYAASARGDGFAYDLTSGVVTLTMAAVPEPADAMLVAIGLLGIGYRVFRNQTQPD